jgi:hypothetical protein
MTVLENNLGSGKPNDVWNAKEDLREFPTNAFGKVDFIHEGLGGRKPSKVCLAEKSFESSKQFSCFPFSLSVYPMKHPLTLLLS